MLPYALKVVWFALSFSGIPACWIVLTVFARAIGSYWGPMLYCVFATILQGIFCLGMIYNMDPFEMPPLFCKAQTFIIYYSAHSLTGVCAAFTLATTSIVVWPTSTIITASSTLAWRNRYYLPIVLFPLSALAIDIPVLLSIHAIQPTEDFHCDVSHPIWGRFLGYAGISMILTIPCFFLSAVAAHRVFRVYTVQRKLLHFTASGPYSQSGNRAANTIQFAKQPSSSSTISICGDHSNSAEDDFPGAPECDVTAMSNDNVLHVDVTCPAATVSVDGTSPPWSRAASSSLSSLSQVCSPERPKWDGSRVSHGTSLPRSGHARQCSPRHTGLRHSPSLAPAIWRLILFQMAFFIIQFLAALSTIIDVATHRPQPTPFGTQHVALVLVGWGPSIVFGHLPAVRRKLVFWRRPDSSAHD